jgi:hypothetical protein
LTTRETVAVDTPALFATSLMFISMYGGAGGSELVLLEIFTADQADDCFVS